MADSTLLNIMKKRRSIRAFSKKAIARSEVMKLLEGAVTAPSGSNIQSWLFGIIDDIKQLNKIFPFSPGLIGKPPCIIVVCSNRKLAYDRGGKLGSDEMAIMDVSMASENIILLATERGWGTCPVKSFNGEAVRKILKLPDYISPDLIISIGYPQNEPKSPPKKKLEDVVFYNKWEEKI
ncbi:nitroreductase family protein [Clostridium sp. WLY-B-L2]|jgi:nitroreductase|uniref:Nitroreductase family protein n=1 Tax=Clostridium aromativorans TaxID=2836848 RepID=A0ABS8N8P4_9CLOT|nr:nitroreductase family protein [Clostridium aromativorans]MCC9296177.1 nitroreductase family protein [Clostridium aromativorans]CAB1245722.1 Nitroreductase family protein [Clostridiaceae bacterium BL-3]